MHIDTKKRLFFSSGIDIYNLILNYLRPETKKFLRFRRKIFIIIIYNVLLNYKILAGLLGRIIVNNPASPLGFLQRNVATYGSIGCNVNVEEKAVLDEVVGHVIELVC